MQRRALLTVRTTASCVSNDTEHRGKGVQFVEVLTHMCTPTGSFPGGVTFASEGVLQKVRSWLTITMWTARVLPYVKDLISSLRVHTLSKLPHCAYKNIALFPDEILRTKPLVKAFPLDETFESFFINSVLYTRFA